MDLSQYVDAVCGAKTVASLNEIFLQMLDQHGVAAVSGHIFPYGGDVASTREPFITTWPKEVRKAYRNDMAGADPIMFAAMTLGIPVHFIKIYPSLKIGEKGESVLDVMRAAGFSDAVSTPVYAKPGSFAYFTCAFRQERHDMTDAEMRRLKFICSEYYFHYRKLTRVRRATLSERERQVLVAMVNDMSNPEIAELLGVSEHTVGTYVRRCFEKLDVNSRTQAVLRYVGGGAVDRPS